MKAGPGGISRSGLSVRPSSSSTGKVYAVGDEGEDERVDEEEGLEFGDIVKKP